MKRYLCAALLATSLLWEGCGGRGRAVDATLQAAPLWASIGAGKAGDDALAKLDASFRKLSAESTDSLRTGLHEWLNSVAGDAAALNDRLDNARILCAFVFKLPPSHGFRGYFAGDANELHVRRRAFLDDLNRGRNVDRTAIDAFLKEFDRLAAECERRA